MIRSLLFAAVVVGGTAIPAYTEVPLPSAAFDRISSAFTYLRTSLKTISGGSMRPGYRMRDVVRGDMVTSLQAAGTLNALVLVEVGSQLSGRIKELYADFNSRVTRGQVIARVEPELYEARLAQSRAELEMARTQVAIQRAQIDRVQAELETATAKHNAAAAETEQAQVVLDSAQREMERKRPLAKRKVIAASEWERDSTAYKTAEAQAGAVRADQLSQAAAVRAAQAALKMAEAQLANTLAEVKQREAVLRQAEIDLERTYIRAPVTGTVVNRAVSGGQTLAASLQTPILFTIAQDLTQMQVEASVVEADISKFAVGQPVTFTVDAYPDRIFTGAVQQIRKAPQIVQNVVTYTAVISARNPDELLLPGMTANLNVVVARRANVLTVPNAALRFRPSIEAGNAAAVAGEASARADSETEGTLGRVFVLGSDRTPRAVSLRLGVTDGRVTEVLGGELGEGERVITGLEPTADGRNETSFLIKFRLQ
ncbi:efflux RND transporter periplasmic adaptor subunit [Sinorhizobium fredii]|nr:efflux RND transporter periplasmic adaptor subunit [Sinorhizobium fredii]